MMAIFGKAGGGGGALVRSLSRPSKKLANGSGGLKLVVQSEIERKRGVGFMCGWWEQEEAQGRGWCAGWVREKTKRQGMPNPPRRLALRGSPYRNAFFGCFSHPNPTALSGGIIPLPCCVLLILFNK